jgi:hypothetical protein
VIVEVEAPRPAWLATPGATGTWLATVPHSIQQVEASGYTDALAAAAKTAADAARAAGREPIRAFSATRAFPTGSEEARTNAHVDANGILY